MSRSKAIVSSYVGVLAYAGVIFLAAGTFHYWQGALYVALAILGATIGHLLTPRGSALIAERAADARSGEAWDRSLLRTMALVSLLTFVVAGVDSGRLHWSEMPLGLTVAGAVVMIGGQWLFALAKRQNNFFSSTVRVQSERDHAVCDTGLYRLVRHPGYLGMLLMVVAFPLVIGSYWALVPALASCGLIVLRTRLEDRFLIERLPGYDVYAAATRWRLLPGVF